LVTATGDLCKKKPMKVNLKALITGTTIISLPALFFWGAAIISLLFKYNLLIAFYSNLPVMIHAIILVVLPCLVLLAITITKRSFETQSYKIVYAALRRFSYFTIISSILLFALSQVFSHS